MANLPMCVICGACEGCKNPADYVEVEIPCLNRKVTVCKCCGNAVKSKF